VYGQNSIQNIPSSRFVQLNGTSFTDKNIQIGKPSMFYFFDITCPHCQITMQTISKEFTNLSHLNLYLVTKDRPEGAVKFIKTFGNNLLNKKNAVILFDVNQEFIEKFKPKKYPAVFLFDKNKKLLLYQDEETKIINLIKKAKAYK
jgi:thiol-disulfide isomerase/thioredoxin